MALHVADLKESYRECPDLEYCFCALYDNDICKFKITFDDMDVSNLIEDYINCMDIYLFEVVDEDSLENKAIAKKYFPYLGKFRLEGRLKATNNYFAPPKESEMLKILFSMYNTNILTEGNLEDMWMLCTIPNSNNILNFIKKIFSKANVKLIGKITLDELNDHLSCLERMFSEIKYSDTYISMKKLLESSKLNRGIINKLGLNDYFMEAIKTKTEEDSIQLTKKHN